MKKLFVFIIIVISIGVGYYYSFHYKKAKPDILLVVIDTLRADHLGAYSYPLAITPNIDKLAAEGTLFNRAFTTMPRTTPAVASILTGLWPKNHGSREVYHPIKKSVLTLAEVLKENGYRTLGATANTVVSQPQNINKGFEDFIAKLNGDAAALNVEVLNKLKSDSKDDRPILIWTMYLEPHAPYISHAKFMNVAEGKACQQLFGSGKATIADIHANKNGVSEQVLKSCIANYDSEIAYVDEQLGKLIEQIKSIRKDRELLVVLTADHGEHFGESGLFYEHGPHIDNVALRVPLIISGPNVKAQVVENIVGLEDIFPSLVGYLKITSANLPNFDGDDFSLQLLKGSSSDSSKQELHFAESGSTLEYKDTHTVFSGRASGEYCYNDVQFSLCYRKQGSPQLYDRNSDAELLNDLSQKYPDKYKEMIEWASRWKPQEVREFALVSGVYKLNLRPLISGGYHKELYNIASDFAEKFDIVKRQEEVLSKLSEVLQNWMNNSGKPTTNNGLESPMGSEEELNTLKTLGYIGS